MVLIDALYICSSDGLRLLVYLVKVLLDKKINFYLLADKRCEGQFENLIQVEYLNASLLARKTFYSQQSCVLGISLHQ